jgi:hypothetical protein
MYMDPQIKDLVTAIMQNMKLNNKGCVDFKGYIMKFRIQNLTTEEFVGDD